MNGKERILVKMADEFYADIILKAKKEVLDDIENLSRPLAGDFGETPIYKEFQELKKKHLSKPQALNVQQDSKENKKDSIMKRYEKIEDKKYQED